MVVCKAGSCVPGDANAYEGIIYKQKGGWCLNQHCGKYQFDSTSGWLLVENEKVGQFSCKRLQKDPLNLTTDAVWKLRDYFHILSSEIISEMQKEDNAGALFVVPAQFNGAEYPSDTRVVHDVEEYTKDPSHSGSRAQLAAHPAAAQFLLDNAATVDHPKGINAVDEIATMDGLDVVNGYMKISSNSNSENEERKQKTLEELKQRLNSLRLLVMDHVTTEGLLPDLQHFATSKHTVGLVYASALVEDVDDDVQAEYRSQVAEQMLIAQYYGALKYAAETTQKAVELTPRHMPRKVFLMPLGRRNVKNSWEIIAKSMAQAIQMLDHKLLVTLEIAALAYDPDPSERESLGHGLICTLFAYLFVDSLLHAKLWTSQMFNLSQGSYKQLWRSSIQRFVAQRMFQAQQFATKHRKKP